MRKNKGFQEILDNLEPYKKELAEKMFDAVFAFACKHGYCGDEEDEPQLLNSECLYQCDEPQIGALDLAGELIDILNGENNV